MQQGKVSELSKELSNKLSQELGKNISVGYSFKTIDGVESNFEFIIYLLGDNKSLADSIPKEYCDVPIIIKYSLPLFVA